MSALDHHTPPHVPPGMPHAVYALLEAECSFQVGNTKDGIANLNHALWLAFTKRETVSEDEARDFYNRIERAADVWGTDA